MRYIKTYEGLFDFFKKKVTLIDLRDKCHQLLSNKKGFKETKDEEV